MTNNRLSLAAISAATLLLSGCFATMPEVVPQSSTTDPIAEAQFIQYSTSANTNSLINFGRISDAYATVDTPSHRKFDHYWEEGFTHMNNKLMLSDEELQNRFTEICTNNKGKMVDGWCVDTKTQNYPIFWAKTKRYWIDENGMKFPHVAMYVLSPAVGKAYTDESWRNFAKAEGFLGRNERREQEKFMLQEGKGSLVCRDVSTGLSPDKRSVDMGYIEDVANKRIKIRIVGRAVDRNDTHEHGSRSSDLGNKTIWDRPHNWFLCD